VLLVTVDTLRADHLGSYGFAHDTSPAIDALAASGVLFERAIAASSRTVPSHASIMTSRNTREHSVGHLNGKSTLRNLETLADHFRRAGYETAAFIGNILLTEGTGLGAGFDVFDDELETPERNRPHVVERRAADTTERALRWLAEPRSKPFFLWVHYQDPHGPYTPPPEDEGRFAIAPAPGERRLRSGEGNEGEGRIPAYQVLPGLDRASQYRSRYAGEIFSADRSIGKLVDAVGPDAVVLLTADHGESFGENRRYFVHTYTSTPDVAHVPFLLRAPGLAPGRRSEIVGHVDVLPTLLELAGLPVPEDARGVALGPMLRGEARLPERLVYCDIGSQLSAYGDEGFLQVVGLAGAWSGRVARNPLWRRYAWSPGTAWQTLERGRGGLPAELERYAASAAPIEELPPPDPELLEKLRALGYGD
jgi:arylsulfatase